MAREFLRDPYWALRAARELEQPIAWPVQYLRAAPKGAQPRVPVDLKSFESCFEEQHGVPEREGLSVASNRLPRLRMVPFSSGRRADAEQTGRTVSEM